MVETEEKSIKVPKLFISYSWTSPTHVDWVMQLATALRHNGVDAIIDQWNLKEGQDAHSFMEQMVRDEDISKVVLICDDKYVQRANDREGGVGVESQIITKTIYGDVSQTKFVALALDSSADGEALLPNFLSNRIYVDFRNSDEYARNLAKLLRWVFDKPEYNQPDIGERPAFLDDQISFEPVVSLVRFPVAKSVGQLQKPNFSSLWRQAAEDHSDFTIEFDAESEGDDSVLSAIKALPPLISQLLVSIRDRVEVGELDDAEIDTLLSFFERAVNNYGNGSTNWGGDITKFLSEFVFVGSIALFLRFRRFETLNNYLSSTFLKLEHGGVTGTPLSISKVGADIPSLSHRNQRLNLRRVSIRADLTKETCEKVPIDFWEYLQADFFLFLFFASPDRDGRWWPDSNIYAADRNGSFPLFLKATNPTLRDKLLAPLCLNSKEKLAALALKISEGAFSHVRWQSSFSTLDIWGLGNFDAILKSYESSQ